MKEESGLSILMCGCIPCSDGLLFDVDRLTHSYQHGEQIM